MEKKPRSRVILSSSILSTMFLGALGWAFTEIKKIAPMEAEMKSLSKTQSSIEKKIDDIHWYMIRQNKVDIPRDK